MATKPKLSTTPPPTRPRASADTMERYARPVAAIPLNGPPIYKKPTAAKTKKAASKRATVLSKPDRAEGYAGKGSWQAGKGGTIRSTKGDPSMGSLTSQQTVRRTKGNYVTKKNTPQGRPDPNYKPRNPLPSKPDRAEGYGKPGGKWKPSGRTGLAVPSSNWSDLDSQITKRNIPKWVPDTPMGRPTRAGSGINAKPTPARKKKTGTKRRPTTIVAQSPRQMMRPIIPRSL